jgi:hypothetical protein
VEISIAALAVVKDAYVVEQVHAQGRTIGSSSDTFGVEAVVVTPLIDSGEYLGLLEQFMEGTDVLEHDTCGETRLIEERLAVKLVPSVGVLVGFLLIPVVLHIVIDGLVGESQILLLFRLIEEDGWILQDICFRMVLEIVD